MEKDLQIEVNGIILCYDDWGIGEVPIIFIHGFPFDKSIWDLQVENLKSCNRVIVFDIRGFGKSSSDHRQPSMDLFADDLIQFMDALQIKKAIVGGLSMGGYIVLNAIKRFPQRFKAIILSDTQCIADSSEGREKRQKTIEHINTYGLSSFTESFVKNIFSPFSILHQNEAVEKIRHIILATPVRIVTSTIATLAHREETCSILAKIVVPTLVICGKEDVVTPPAQSEMIACNIAGSVLHLIDNAGHLSNIEQPKIFNQHLKNFVSDL